METREYLARFHRRVVTELIEAVLDEWAGDMGQVERNFLGVVLRQEVETRLVPGLLAVDALLMGADAGMLGRLPERLDRVQAPLLVDWDFLEEMGRRLTPVGYEVLSDNLGLLAGESETSRTFTDCLWSMTLSISKIPSEK